ncbi:phosphatase PAP2 family protein [Streptomyces sp. AV19]|uniref:phosphatase PAP2 family protein n=1 Tax=Streptomyces sp. AV19 TaxID=2793068 RepID=UPI0018FE0FB7|nr:phosphatase PAP2 family protein [Streptomyces sp. AV19]MBH1933509.1 phosphatase PAP2 family protein [Streptomyces sp. AV19]MDG4532158.1 phosphatase PAP2 family protein [Streptomyces sp. AV19]
MPLTPRVHPAAIATVAGLLGFAVVTTVVAHGGWDAVAPDAAAHAWSVAHRPDAAVTSARALTATGTGFFPYLLAALAGWIWRRRIRWSAAAMAVLACGQGVRALVLALAARPRPPAADWAAHADGFSFPSGHTTTSAMAAGLLAVAVAARAGRGRGRWAAVAALGCWAVSIGLTRVYLGVHWLTDVVAGWAFAAAWLGGCVWVGVGVGVAAPRRAGERG